MAGIYFLQISLWISENAALQKELLMYFILMYWKYRIGKIIAVWAIKTKGTLSRPRVISMRFLRTESSTFERTIQSMTGFSDARPIVSGSASRRPFAISATLITDHKLKLQWIINLGTTPAGSKNTMRNTFKLSSSRRAVTIGSFAFLLDPLIKLCLLSRIMISPSRNNDHEYATFIGYSSKYAKWSIRPVLRKASSSVLSGGT